MIIECLDKNNFIYLKDEKNSLGKLGITHNKIVEIPNFIKEDTAKKMIKYFEYLSDRWGDIAFYGSYGMGFADEDPILDKFDLPVNFFSLLRNKFKDAVEIIFDKSVRPNTSHAQKWEKGGFAHPHSDNSDFDGNPNSFSINKYVAILYLNENYGGGELYFPDHSIDIKPKSCSLLVFPGGVENIHGVKEITEGTRYTMVSFWDYADAEYPKEVKDAWEKELKEIRKMQKKQREEWKKGNKFA